MDLDSAAPAPSRRGLIGALGAAGIASAAALGIARPASAAPVAPIAPTASDKVLLRQAMELELSARDLYRQAIAAGSSDIAVGLATVFAENHASYADKIAGASGFSANTRNDAVFAQFQSSFSSKDEATFAEAGITLENTAAATHESLFVAYESSDSRTLTASIIVVEARMATVLSDLADLGSNFDDLFDPSAEPLVLDGGGA